MTTTQKPLTRREIVSALRKHHPNIGRNTLLDVLATVFEEIMIACRNGRKVELRRFGTFQPRVRSFRATNPRRYDAKDLISHVERFDVKFKVSAPMRKSIPKQH